ncbi:Hypothetical protein A7982_10717 [Minicystis rosea]|nr:Hypothetical protein A7982_10717 [Minicystis rosea]
MPTHTVLAAVDEVPVLRSVVELLVPLPDEARRFVFVVCASDLSDRVDAALAGLPLIVAFDDEATTAKLDERTLGDLRALLTAIGVMLEAPPAGPYITESPYPSFSARVVASEDRAAIRAHLEKAGLTAADVTSITGGVAPISDEAAIAHALAPFEEHHTPEVVSAVRAYLEGPEGPVPPAVLEAKSEYYGDRPAGIVGDALTGAVERWNPRISGKLLDLWIALRRPLETDLNPGLGEEGLPPELGFDRVRRLAAAFEARGLHPALAALTATNADGSSKWFLAPTLLARPEIFAQAVALDRGVARALAALAAPIMGLERSPSVLERWRSFLATHSEALGTEALLKLAGMIPDAIDEKHLEHAAIGEAPLEVCKLAAKMEEVAAKRFAGALRRANEQWIAAADPVSFIATLQRILEREAKLVDGNVAWTRLVDLVEQNPADPFGDAPVGSATMFGGLVAHQLPKPTGAVKERIIALCKEKGRALGKWQLSLEKKVGIKPPPPPYAASDLEGLPDAFAKAWKTARQRSWDAGIRLPAGASVEALAAAEETLGTPLPADLRSFLALHDGAGEDECFRGGRLYGIAEAVEKRAFLLGVAGAPFDATWLPVTDDGAGNHACVVLKGKEAGSVMDFDHETGRGRRLAKSFAAFLQGASWE